MRPPQLLLYRFHTVNLTARIQFGTASINTECKCPRDNCHDTRKKKNSEQDKSARLIHVRWAENENQNWSRFKSNKPYAIWFPRYVLKNSSNPCQRLNAVHHFIWEISLTGFRARKRFSVEIGTRVLNVCRVQRSCLWCWHCTSIRRQWTVAEKKTQTNRIQNTPKRKQYFRFSHATATGSDESNALSNKRYIPYIIMGGCKSRLLLCWIFSGQQNSVQTINSIWARNLFHSYERRRSTLGRNALDKMQRFRFSNLKYVRNRKLKKKIAQSERSISNLMLQ